VKDLRSPELILVVLGLLAVQRLWELKLSRENLRAIGGRRPVADPTSNWVLMVAVHTLLIVGTALEVMRNGDVPSAPLFWGGLALFGLGQALRQWCIRSLGPAWNARGVVFPETPIVARGPYRWLRHPNYLAVIVEVAALPLAAGAFGTLIGVNLLNAVALRNRIRGENAHLRQLPGYVEAMGDKGGVFPRLHRKRQSRTRAGGYAERS